mgnify:CR=1 FL=1
MLTYLVDLRNIVTMSQLHLRKSTQHQFQMLLHNNRCHRDSQVPAFEPMKNLHTSSYPDLPSATHEAK